MSVFTLANTWSYACLSPTLSLDKISFILSESFLPLIHPILRMLDNL
jgi:hypothetical protein